MSFEPNLDKAKEKLDTFKKEIELIKLKEKEEHFKKPITRNDQGQAILHIHDKDGKVVDEVIVDDDKWHELSQYDWSKTANYYQSVINGRSVLLHRYLLNAKKGNIVDHINDNGNTVKNNTLANLRISTPTGNSHNKTKLSNKTSQYIGVSFAKYKFNAKITKDNVKYNLGNYNTEVEAAIAYNLKAKQLYKEFANTNTIPEDMIQKYELDVRNKLTTAGKL
jgi:hypothetical protein